MFKRLWVTLLLSFLLSGCSVLALSPADNQPTPTVLPTTNPEEGLRVVASPACQVTTLPTIQVDQPAGDLLGFNPDGSLLAFIAPVNHQWGWYSGNLTLLSLETGEQRATRDIKVTGDLTWSPDGSRIAFTGLHTPGDLYTVIVLLTSDFTPLDLYAAGAATDDYGSRKGIVRWAGSDQIRVMETCGVDCSREVEIGITGQGQRIINTGRKADDNSLEIILDTPNAGLNPDWDLMNASPDGSLFFYVDNTGQAWVTSPGERTKFRLPLDLGEVHESKWSADSNLIAVRTDEKIFLFDLTCSLDLSP